MLIINKVNFTTKMVNKTMMLHNDNEINLTDNITTANTYIPNARAPFYKQKFSRSKGDLSCNNTRIIQTTLSSMNKSTRQKSQPRNNKLNTHIDQVEPAPVSRASNLDRERV